MPKLPFEIRNRSELVDALSFAAQIEHAVLIEYLYAAFSCKHSLDQSEPLSAQWTSRRIARELYLITHDEMQHLGTVLQLLATIGAPPVLDLGGLPFRGPDLPFEVALTRVDIPTLDRFIATESPPTDAERAFEAPDAIRFDFLGDLYRVILRAVEDSGDALFAGRGVTGTDPLELRFDRNGHPVATTADAIASLRWIIEQGEGAGAEHEDGHWTRFIALKNLLVAVPDAERGAVSWPCVPNPTVLDSGSANTTLLTAPLAVGMADVGNRAYRALWLVLGGVFSFDWSASDDDSTIDQRRAERDRSMMCARWIMATVVRPLGEMLARLHAFDGQPDGPTAGFCFEQYGEFRLPTQPDARAAVVADELARIADDLAALADAPAAALSPVQDRIRSVGESVSMIRRRYLGKVEAPPENRFEPPEEGRRWLVIDFSGWYQARLATGGDPFDDPRGVSGWQFALPGEPNLDRILRLQPSECFLRDAIHPRIAIGVTVRHADISGMPIDALVGASVELLDEPRFEGHNGVVALDGLEPIVPLRLHIAGGGWSIGGSSADQYVAPYNAQASLGQVETDDAASLRRDHGAPTTDRDIAAYLADCRSALSAAHTAAVAAGDAERAARLSERLASLGQPPWPLVATVAWRLQMVASDRAVIAPPGSTFPVSAAAWWLELLSTGFDPDASCALVRGVLHVPLDAETGYPHWRMAMPPVANLEPADAMGVRPGR